jgi:ribosomal protein L39E
MSKKDKTIKIRVCILNKQNSSINFSIRLKEGLSIEQVNQEINNFVYKTLK